MYRPKFMGLLLLLIVAAMSSVTCTHPPDARHPERPPECVYVPEEPEVTPEDPFEMDGDDDGLTVQERLDFIKRGVASTIRVRVRRYSPEKGYTFHSGTGVFIDESHALTAEHVIHNQVDLYVILRRIVQGTMRVGQLRWERAEVERADPRRDVALLRVQAPPELVHPMPIAHNWVPRRGELLWQFGARTVWSRGRVVRQVPDDAAHGVIRGMIQMHQLGQCGDSGGPVTNTHGELVGLMLRGDSDCGRQYFVPIDTALRAIGRAQ